MDDKNAKNLIESALNSQKPDKKVLFAAKEYMKEGAPRAAKNTLRFYALASCSLILIIAGIVFALPVSENNGIIDNAFHIPVVFYGLLIGIALIITGILLGVVTIVFRVKNIKK